MENLEDPEWMTVNCDEDILGDILCVAQSENDKYTNFSFVTFGLQMYDKDCVIVNKTCYLFIWNSKDSISNEKDVLRATVEIQHLSLLFDIVSEPFPAIFSPDMKHVITYVKYFEKYIFERPKKTNQLGLCILTRGTSQFESNAGNLFKCKDNTFISSYTCVMVTKIVLVILQLMKKAVIVVKEPA